MGYEAHGGVKHEEELGKVISALLEDVRALTKRVEQLERKVK